MNKLEKILNAVGLEPETEYLMIKDGQPSKTKSKIDGMGNFLYWDLRLKTWRVSEYDLMLCLCDDNIKFKKIPFKPEQGKYYWFVDVSGNCYDKVFNVRELEDLLNLAIENCFKTKEDAEKNVDKYVELFENITTGKTLLVSEVQDNNE